MHVCFSLPSRHWNVSILCSSGMTSQYLTFVYEQCSVLTPYSDRKDRHSFCVSVDSTGAAARQGHYEC